MSYDKVGVIYAKPFSVTTKQNDKFCMVGVKRCVCLFVLLIACLFVCLFSFKQQHIGPGSIM